MSHQSTTYQSSHKFQFLPNDANLYYMDRHIVRNIKWDILGFLSKELIVKGLCGNLIYIDRWIDILLEILGGTF